MSDTLSFRLLLVDQKTGEEVSVDSNDRLRSAVQHELARFDQYLSKNLQEPMSKFERAMVNEYLHSKIRGLINSSDLKE
jgi:hypothetical protein